MIQDMTRLFQQRQQIQAQQNQATKPPTNYAPTSFMVDRKATARKVYRWAHQDLNLEPTDSPSINKNEWFQRFPGRLIAEIGVLGHGCYKACYKVGRLMFDRYTKGVAVSPAYSTGRSF
jgi:hypothetical protein